MGAFKGKIHWFDMKKGYGYLTDGYGNSYFYHRHDIRKGREIVIKGFEADDEVEFDLAEGEKGKYAVNITLSKESDTEPRYFNKRTPYKQPYNKKYNNPGGYRRPDKREDNEGDEDQESRAGFYTPMGDAMKEAGITPDTNTAVDPGEN